MEDRRIAEISEAECDIMKSALLDFIGKNFRKNAQQAETALNLYAHISALDYSK